MTIETYLEPLNNKWYLIVRVDSHTTSAWSKTCSGGKVMSFNTEQEALDFKLNH